jgi:hypothetical protein
MESREGTSVEMRWCDNEEEMEEKRKAKKPSSGRSERTERTEIRKGTKKKILDEMRRK